MRKAEIDSAWEKCRASQKQRLNVSQLGIVAQQGSYNIPIASRVCALLGENGAGKTTLLQSLASIDTPAPAPSTRSRIDSLTLMHNGKIQSLLNRTTTPQTNPTPHNFPKIEKIDAAADIFFIQTYLKNQSNLEEYLNQYEYRQLTTKELGIFKFVTNRNYSRFSIREIESPSNPDDVFPFFDASIDTLPDYDSRSMGFGELCTCYLIWRIGRCEKGSIILLDEPDSHLSAASRRALTDVFAVLAAERELWILFTSHSIEPIEKLRENELILINRPEILFGAPVISTQQKRDSIVQLGFTLSRRFLLAVEDVDAEELLSQILSRWQPQVARACEIVAMVRGAEEISKLLELFPQNTSVCSLTAVLDGDKKQTIAQNGSILFLPGNDDPMHQLQIWCSNNINTISDRLGVDKNFIGTALANVASVNYHDFCSALAEELQQPSLNTKDIRKILLSAWLTDPQESAKFEILANEIKVKLENTSFFS